MSATQQESNTLNNQCVTIESRSSVRHLGIIMDGNRRWAKERGIPVLQSHEYGYQAFRTIIEAAFDRGIFVVTAFAFSTENWNRPSAEVSVLMELMARAIREQGSYLNEKGIQMRFSGTRENLSSSLIATMQEVENMTKNNTEGILNLAFNYGGRQELLVAIKDMIAEGIDPSSITEEVVSNHLSTAGLPDPDLIIRTSGEHRLSGFLPWQAVYSELYFSNLYWPEFTPEHLDEALAEFERRTRRFGS